MMLLLPGVVLALLLHQSFQPGYTLFSNDGPLGRLVSQCHRVPEAFTGVWQDLNTLGYREVGAVPSATYALRLVLGPVAFSKFYTPLALWFLGLGAWCYFRQLGLAPMACLLGGLAASLNSDFFSAACWGVGPQAVAVGTTFLALAALADPSPRQRWLRVALAGLAVGLGVAEAADIGAIFSLFVAAFMVYQTWITEGPRIKIFAVGAGRLALVAACAGLFAAQSVFGLVQTQIEGVAVMAPEARSKAGHWDWATQWSLPKREALGLLVPGLFGYRMDTPDGGAYWGAAGRDPAWERYWAGDQQGPPPKGFLRFSGGGDYAGVLAVLLALWAAAQSFRRKDAVFNRSQRPWLRFWLAAGIVSLLLAFGRYAPFYRWVYALPYFSTIRNPVKFLHLLELSLVVLFAYGVDGLWRQYLRPGGASPTASGAAAGAKGWWARATRWEKTWIGGCALILVVSLLAWAVYANYRPALERYLQSVQFDEAKARAIAGFSLRQIGWFGFFFALAAGLLTLIFRGTFTGAGAQWGARLLGLLLVADLGRANQPWIIYLDYEAFYASNPVIDALREKPYEHRVALLPFQQPSKPTLFEQAYRNQWLPLLFAYYDVQSLDYFQLPRKPEDLAAFDKALDPAGAADPVRLTVRRWQLTNTRYFLGSAALANSLDRDIDPRIHTVGRFDLVTKPGVQVAANWGDLTAVLAPNGPCALFEFAGALPRAKLYARWEPQTNDPVALAELASAAFDPERTVLVAGGLPESAQAGDRGTNSSGGTVEFVSYAPKRIRLTANATGPAVLLLNDRFDPDWKVAVDGKPGTLLRCNYLMRGVYLAPGKHQVEFRFQPPARLLYVSLAAAGLGVLLLGVVLASGRRKPSPAAGPSPHSAASHTLPQPARQLDPSNGGKPKSSRRLPVKPRR